MSIIWKYASPSVSPNLAEWNHQLIQEEGHRNVMTIPELACRMHGWLEREYKAVVYSVPGLDAIAYALYRCDTDMI